MTEPVGDLMRRHLRPISLLPVILMTTVLLVLPSAAAGALPRVRQGAGPQGAGAGVDGATRYRNIGMRAVARPGSPVVDGRIGSGEWDAAESYAGFTQFEPDPDTPSAQHTRAWLLYDETALYLAFRCEQPDFPIQEYVTRRDRLPGDPDFVGVLVDPFLTWKEGYIFAVNPAGVQMDGTLDSNGESDLSWDSLWRSAARHDGEAWIVEMAIPWTTFRFPESDTQTWGINFFRQIGERSELSTWAPLEVGANSLVTANALLIGIEGVEPGRSLRLNPYATVRRSRAGTDSSGREWVGEQGLQYLGADLRAGLGSNLVLDLTVNPDFGHIEADQEQVSFSPYELFFDEKRPFFLEGQQTFSAPINLFYSRRIHNPLAGAKLSGQLGGTQMGLISAFDEPLGDYDPSPYETQSVLRLKQDLGTASYVGALVTSQDRPEQSRTGAGYERNFAADFNFRPSDRISLTGMGAVAASPGVGPRSAAWYLAARYSSRAWHLAANYLDAQPDFSAYLGFLPRPGQQSMNAEAIHRIEGDLGPIKWINAGVAAERFQHSTSAVLADQALVSLVNVDFRKGDSLALREIEWQVRQGDVTYQGRAWNLEYSANRSGALSGYAGTRFGDGFDYGDFDSTGDESLLHSISMWGGIQWRPTHRAAFSTNLNYIRRAPFFSADPTEDVRILGLIANYQFSPEIFGRLNLQVRRDRDDLDTGSPGDRRRILVNALLGYELGPGSVFYLAYNHYDLGTGPASGELDRVLFLKVARLLSF